MIDEYSTSELYHCSESSPSNGGVPLVRVLLQHLFFCSFQFNAKHLEEKKHPLDCLANLKYMNLKDAMSSSRTQERSLKSLRDVHHKGAEQRQYLSCFDFHSCAAFPLLCQFYLKLRLLLK